jgi:hypothetical protein
VVGDRKVCEVQITWTGAETYVTGGMDISAEVLALTGFSYITNAEPVFVSFGGNATGGVGPTAVHPNRVISVFWSVQNQKLQFIKDGKETAGDTRTQMDNGVLLGHPQAQYVFLILRLESGGSA